MRSNRFRTLRAITACGLAMAAAPATRDQRGLHQPAGLEFDRQRVEFIELYGKPGMDLTGYAVALVKGGYFVNGVLVEPQEIDEAFSLDGITLPANGLFAIVNSNTAGFSAVGNNFLTPNPAWNPAMPDSITNRRWLNGITFAALHIPTTDTVGNLSNDGSTTVILVRKRPFHSINAQGRSVYAPGYAWRKDVNHDVNYDEVIDFGLPFAGGGARVLQPYQSVDEFGWSHTGGKEYTRSRQQVMTDTPGFNPDAVSRLNYFVTNPQRGHRSRPTDDGFEIVFTHRGRVVRLRQSSRASTLAYDTGVDTDGFPQTKALTDPNGPRLRRLLRSEPRACRRPAAGRTRPASSSSTTSTSRASVSPRGIRPPDQLDHQPVPVPARRFQLRRRRRSGRPRPDPLASGATSTTPSSAPSTRTRPTTLPTTSSSSTGSGRSGSSSRSS